MAQKIPLPIDLVCGIGRGKTIKLTLNLPTGVTVASAVFGAKTTPTAIAGTGAVSGGNVVKFRLLASQTAGQAPQSKVRLDAAIELAGGDPNDRRDVLVGTLTLEERAASF
jgi:hypothetical protein